MTNHNILTLDAEFKNFPPALQYATKSAIRQFYNEHGVRLETTKKRIKELQNEYFVFVDGKIKMTEPPPAIVRKKTFLEKIGLKKYKEIPTPTFKPEIVFKEGVNKEEFEVKFQELMSAERNVTLAKV